MVVADIIGKEPLHVALIKGDDMVRQIAPTTLDPSLRHAVLPRTLDRGPNRTDGHRPHRDGDLQAILGVPVKNQKSWRQLIGESLPQLLHDPRTGGMWCDIEMEHTSADVADDEKAVEHAASQRR